MAAHTRETEVSIFSSGLRSELSKVALYLFVLLSPPSFPLFSHTVASLASRFSFFLLAFVWWLEAADGAWEGAIQSQRSGSDFVTIKHSSCRQTSKVLLITTLNPLHPQTPAPPASCLSVLFAAWFGLPQWLFSYWSAASSFLDLTNCQKSSYYSRSCWDLLG